MNKAYKSNLIQKKDQLFKKQQKCLKQKNINIQEYHNPNIRTQNEKRNSKTTPFIQKSNINRKINEIQGIDSIQIVSIDNEGIFHINKQSIQYICEQWNNQNNFSICSIVGKVKTGKSFLINNLFQNQYCPIFAQNNTLAPCTKGIWISKRMLKLDKKSVLIFDTQGLGSHFSSQQIDYKIWLLTLLISDVVCYNNIGPIDEQTLNNFSLAIQISKIFSKRLSTKQSFQSINIPKLMWILRDFSLELIDKRQGVISSNQYLQKCLKQEQVNINQNQINSTIMKKQNKNQIRKSIKNIFKTRKCITLVLPFDQDNQIRQQFQQGVIDLKKQLVQLLESNQLKVNRKQTNYESNFTNNFIYKLETIIECLNASTNSQQHQSFIFDTMSRCQNKLKFQNLNRKIQQQCNKIIEKYELLFQKTDQQCENIHENIIKMDQLREQLNKQIQQLQRKIQSKFLIYKDQHINEQIIIKTHRRIKGIIQTTRSKILQRIIQYQQNYYQQSNRYEQDQHKISQHLQNSILCFKNINNLQQLLQQFSQIKQQHLLLLKDNIYLEQKDSSLKQIQMQFIKRKQEILMKQIYPQNTLRKQIDYLKKQNQQLKRQNQVFYTKIQQFQQQSDKQKYSQIHHYNKNYNINKISNKYCQQQQLNEKQKLKGYSQCSNCNKSFYIPYIIIGNHQDLSIKLIKSCFKKSKNRKGLNALQFNLQIKLNNKNWIINRRIKDFLQLNHILSLMFEESLLPKFFMIKELQNQHEESSFMKNQDNISREIKQAERQIINYLEKLKYPHFIRNTRIFQKFIKINKQYFDL